VIAELRLPTSDCRFGIFSRSKITRRLSKKAVSFFVLSMTYADYSQLAKTPAAGELMDKILDADPLVEMHHCGNRQAFTSIVDELNALILAGKLDRCRRLK